MRKMEDITKKILGKSVKKGKLVSVPKGIDTPQVPKGNDKPMVPKGITVPKIKGKKY